MATTAAAVKLVLGKQYDSVTQPDLTPYLDLAAAIVADVVDCAADKSVTLSTDRQELIERYVAAYAYLTLDPGYKSKSTLSASGSFDFDAERVKKLAVGLDTSGCLAGILAGRAQASLTWLGKNTQDEIDWTDRNTL